MKITRIEQFFPRQRIRLVKITTDDGLVGWGETTLEGKSQEHLAAVDELADYLVGKDPLRIEHHWQHIYRSAFFRGGTVLMTALSGIDQALWDIAGKHYGVARATSCWAGHVRDRIRVYAHWGIHDLSDEGLQSARERLECLQTMAATPPTRAGPGASGARHEPPAVIDEFVKRAYMMREWVGPDVELCFDFHGKMTPGAGHRDLPRDQGDAPDVRRGAGAPGERRRAQARLRPRALPHRHRRAPADPLGVPRRCSRSRPVAYIQPDGSHVGGISELKKVANMAEVYYVHVMPHCAIGPVAFAACLQVDAAVPNFLIQEQVDASLGDGLLQEDWQVKDGYIDLPTKPGLGFDIDEDAAERTIDYTEELGGEFFYPSDGSVADW